MIKFLIVDDSISYNNMLFMLLRKPEYLIFQAFSLEEANKFLEKETIDYLVLDLILPDGDGEELVEKLSLVKNSPKIIILSADRDIQRRNYLFENGVIDYFSKDTSIKSIVKEIHTLIETLIINESKNILLIDDSSFIRKTVKNIFEVKNYNVFLAKDSKETFNLLNENNNIDLIFLDLELPVVSGLEILEKLKHNPIHEDIPVIILSSSEDRIQYSSALKNGAIDFIRKPFLTEELLLKAHLHISRTEHLKKIISQAKELKEYKRVLNESDMISKTDTKGIIKEANDLFCKVSGYSQEYLIGKSHKVIRHPDMPKNFFENLWKKINEHKTFKGIIKNRRRDGSSYYVDATISPIIGVDGNIKEIIGIRHDITDVMNPKKQLLADLTYLENPTLIFLQISNYNLFKEFYSETLMHTFEFEFEQEVLNYFPEILNLKKVYTLGNGLYAFLKNQKIEDDKLKDTLKNVISKFKKKGVLFKNTNYDINICISYTNNVENILDDAHLGIQYALTNKIPIVNSKDFYKHAQIQARNKLKNIGIIKDALAKEGSFISYFQPIINNENKEIEKYESLIRLIDKKGNVLSPFQFLDIAKKTGYYSNITELVINNTFEALAKTNKEININISCSDIENSNIRKLLWELISKKEHFGRITFELLEDEEVKNFSLVKDFILESKIKYKIKIAIDDFGSGYSNYERLLEFQPDILKIDGSLIKNIVEDNYSQHVVESIIVFAKKQNIKTVAEFVTNEEIYKLTKKLGIDYSQGYHFGEPSRLF